MSLERVLNFCIKLGSGVTLLCFRYIFFYKDWAYILNFNEECFDEICTTAFCESISKLEDRI